MEQKNYEPELIEYYEKKIRNGFPSGEVRHELMKKGYSEEEVNHLNKEIYAASIKKSSERSKNFQHVITFFLILVGFFMAFVIKSNMGYTLIVLGSIKLIFSFFTETKKD